MSIVGTTALTEIWSKVKALAANYLPLTGGTLTGPLEIMDSDIDISTTPAESQYIDLINLVDVNGDPLLSVTAIHETSGAHGFQLSALGGNDMNTLQMCIDNNGTPKMWIPQATTWRSALGAQATLSSGSNIKTINGTSVLGSGNISTAELPTVAAADNGKVLRVVNGAWSAAALPSASGVNF